MPTSSLYIEVFDLHTNRIEDAEISIYQNQNLVSRQLSQANTATLFILDTKSKEYSFDPFYPEPYISYDIEIVKKGFQSETRNDIRVFEDINSTLEIVMVEDDA